MYFLSKVNYFSCCFNWSIYQNNAIYCGLYYVLLWLDLCMHVREISFWCCDCCQVTIITWIDFRPCVIWARFALFLSQVFFVYFIYSLPLFSIRRSVDTKACNQRLVSERNEKLKLIFMSLRAVKLLSHFFFVGF